MRRLQTILRIAMLCVTFALAINWLALTPNGSTAAIVIPGQSSPTTPPGPPCLAPSSDDISPTQINPSIENATLHGHVVPDILNGKATLIGALPVSQTVHLELVFAIRNLQQFQSCLASIQDPTSPNFQHFLDATTLSPYVPTPGVKASVSTFLKVVGFDVTDGASPLVLDLTAKVGLIQATLGVKINLYTDAGSRFYGVNVDPSLPQNFASIVTGIIGLDNSTVIKPAESPCTGPYCPQGIQVGYSLTSLYSSNYDGTGQKVAIVDAPGDQNIQTAINTYDTQYGLPSITLDIRYPDGTPSSWNAGWASEAAMDVEAVHSVAKGAGIVLLYDTGDLMNSVDYVANNNLATIVSNSWTYECTTGPCSDAQLGSATVSAYDSRLATDASKGLTILFASGDSGAKPDGTNLGTEFPSSDPNVLAVGATNLVLSGCGTTTCSGYSSETGASISGGGYSGYFSEPSWQTSAIGVKSGRAVPDVSMMGYSPNFWVYSTLSDECGTVHGPPAADMWFGCAGTSLSTPLWAGFLGVTLQVRGGTGFGNVDPLIYQKGSSASYSSDFHDVTSGSNNGYSAGTGWDPVTGWGTPIANNLAMDLAQQVTSTSTVLATATASATTTSTVTSYTGTSTSTSVISTTTTVTATPSTSTSTTQVTQVITTTGTSTLSSTTTTTSTSYTSTQTSTSTIMATTTITLGSSTSTGTIQTTQVSTSTATSTQSATTTRTSTSYTGTTTLTSTSTLFTTTTVGSSFEFFGFLSLLALAIGRAVISGKGRRVLRQRLPNARMCNPS